MVGHWTVLNWTRLGTEHDWARLDGLDGTGRNGAEQWLDGTEQWLERAEQWRDGTEFSG